jgi:hypothetical protein
VADVVEAGPSRSGRGWAVVAVLALAALVVAALRGGGGTPEASPSPRVTTVAPTEAGPAPVPSPEPVPRVSATPGAPFAVTVVTATEVRVGRRVEYRAPRDHRIDSFAKVAGGWAAVVVEEPVRSANPFALVVHGARGDRTIAVDDGTRVFPGVTRGEVWTAGPEGRAQRRDARGDVLATERLPAPWRAVGETTGALVLVDEEGGRVGLWRRRAVEPLAEQATFGSATPTHVAWLQGSCAVGCSAVVLDSRSGNSWSKSLVAGPVYLDVEVHPDGETVAAIASFSGGTVVYVAERESTVEEVATTPQGSVSFLTAEWVDARRLAVFDVSDDVRAFAFDLVTWRLESAGTYEGRDVVAVLGDPL